MRLPQPPLLIVTDRRQATQPLDAIVHAACAAGCRWVSLREKDLPASEQVALFVHLRPIAHASGAVLTLHGDAALAHLAQADGVHLPAGADTAAARAALGSEALIGISLHSANEAARMDPHDYAIAGPAYETASKPGYGPALGAAGMAAICAVSRVPVIAIGGIGPENITDLLRAGAAGIAVMGAVMRSPEPGREAQRLLAALEADKTLRRVSRR
jgi:thiamine-phosphate pyrophosphorylase